MSLSHKYCFRPCLGFFRKVHHHSSMECNHYETLGLSPSASKAQIKAAYYELSKKHHPDRNQGSDESARIFRLVRAAYEVLGNEQKRMQYDKERIFKVVRKPVVNYNNTSNGPDYKDDAERIHFQSRVRAPFRKYSYGKTTYYDFDAWYDGHYGKTSKEIFELRQPRQFTEFSKNTEFSEKQIQIFSRIKSAVLFFIYAVIIISTYTVHKNRKR